jgi:hypothetical protein
MLIKILHTEPFLGQGTIYSKKITFTGNLTQRKKSFFYSFDTINLFYADFFTPHMTLVDKKKCSDLKLNR